MPVPNETPSVIRISRMLNSRIPHPMTPKLSPISVKPAPMFRAGRAEGGVAHSREELQGEGLQNLINNAEGDEDLGHIVHSLNAYGAIVPRSLSGVKPIPPERRGGRVLRAEGGIVDSPAAPFTGPIVTSGGGRTDDVPMHVPLGSYVLPADVVSHIGDGNSVAGLKLLTMMFGAPLGHGGAPWGANMPKVTKGAGVREPGIGKPNAPYPAMALPMPKAGAMYAEGGATPKQDTDQEEEMRELQQMQLPEPPRTYFPSNGIMVAHSMMTARGGHVEGHGKPTPIWASGGEFVIPPDEVKRRGGGDISKGHKALDAWVLHLRGKAIKTLQKLPGPAK